jgi:hypothetical protein
MELFMVKTGFYNIVTRLEVERREGRPAQCPQAAWSQRRSCGSSLTTPIRCTPMFCRRTRE